MAADAGVSGFRGGALGLRGIWASIKSSLQNSRLGEKWLTLWGGEDTMGNT